MQKLAVLLILILSLPARAQQSSARASLDGYQSGDVYANDFFEFRFKSPVGWEVAPPQTKQVVLKSLNASAPYADNRILIMLLRPNGGEPQRDVIGVFSATYQHSGSDGADGAVDYFKRSRASDTQTDLASPIRTVQFGGRTLAREDDRIKGQPQFMVTFALVKSGYLLSFRAVAPTQDRLEAAVRVLSASIQFK